MSHACKDHLLLPEIPEKKGQKRRGFERTVPNRRKILKKKGGERNRRKTQSERKSKEKRLVI